MGILFFDWNMFHWFEIPRRIISESDSTCTLDTCYHFFAIMPQFAALVLCMICIIFVVILNIGFVHVEIDSCLNSSLHLVVFFFSVLFLAVMYWFWNIVNNQFVCTCTSSCSVDFRKMMSILLRRMRPWSPKKREKKNWQHYKMKLNYL